MEGNSARATCRLTTTAKGTVLRLLAEIGEACARFHDQTVQGIRSTRVQCDEIWSFISIRAKNLRPELQGVAGFGDAWIWVGLDADSKLAISWRVGGRDPETANGFVADLASRLATRVQLTTDGNPLYLRAVEAAFGWNGVDYAMLVKEYAEQGSAGRYSPPVCVGAEKHWIMGKPVKQDVSTSYVERSNLTIRMQMRRFTRLTNAFSKKLANHIHAVALHFVAYNFCKAHGTAYKASGGHPYDPSDGVRTHPPSLDRG